MATPIETWAGPLGELRAASASGGGTALTTTPAFIEIPDGSHHLQITPTNFTTAKVAKLALNPYLIALFTHNALTAVTDGSQVLQDGKTTTFALASWDTAANNNYLYIGARLPFRGLDVIPTVVNAVAATVTVQYWNGAWGNVAGLTDGTANAGATFGKTGQITWTVPTDWASATLVDVAVPGDIVHRGDKLFWVRLSVSALLTAGLTVQSILAMSRSTSYAEYLSGQTLELSVWKGVNGVGNIEALTDGGTANLIVNCATRYGDGGFV